MNILNSFLRYLPHGFTLVELMAVIAIMAILAAVEATGVVHLVPAYGRRSCEEERTQAARAFVSNWLETRNLSGDASAALGSTTLDTSGGTKWDGGFDPQSPISVTETIKINKAAVKNMNSLQQPNIFILLPLPSPLERTPNLHLRPVFRHSPSGH